MAAAPSTTITLAPLDIQSIIVPLIGDSPLIVHAWSEKARKQMADKQQQKASAGRAAKVPWEDFTGSLYWMDGKPATPTEADVEAGRFGFPAIAFKAAAVTAITSLAGVTKVAARQAFHIDGELVEIIGPTPSMREDVCRVGMGTADLRYRGEFSPWAVNLPVKFNAGVMSADQVVNLFNLAGFACGVGEWRPERDGTNGRFHVATDQDRG